MNITNQPYVSNRTSFKAIQPEIMEKFGEFPTKCRISIAKNYNVLQNSEFVDLILNKNGKLALKTKQCLNDLIGCMGCLPAGTEIKLSAGTDAVQEGNGIRCKDVQIGENNFITLLMNFANPNFASDALKDFKFHGGDTYSDKLPQLGALIDAACRISKPFTEIREIISQTF